MSTPSEDELTEALISLKARDPQLGISKVHALLLKTHPEWTVSEKRTRKILQSQGLTISASFPPPSTDPANPRSPTTASQNHKASAKSKNAPGPTSSNADPPVFPTSQIIQSLDVRQWSPKIAVRYFDKHKGKGLVALEDMKEGEVVWKEDPLIVAPEWEIYDMQVSSAACGYCTTPLNPTSPLILSCPSSSSSPSIPCPYRFCNRLCLARSAKVHPLLCPTQNPASVPLLKFAKEAQWMAIHALSHVTSRILLANELSGGKDGESVLRSDWDIVNGMATLGMEERAKFSYISSTSLEPDRPAWKKAYKLYLQAFKEPKTPAEQKKLSKLLKRPLPADIATHLFDYDLGFLKGLGRMSLNLEAHGGLYALHSHLNHDCTPNISIRHLDQRTSLSRITVLTRRPISAGEELSITYVDPRLSLPARRRELEAWGFGVCRCARCVEEEIMGEYGMERKLKGEGGVPRLGEKEAKVKIELDDMVRELKAGLGVV